MTSYDVKRLALILALQAEIEAMKTANAEKAALNRPAVYCASLFWDKAREFKELADKHYHQL